MPFRVSEQGDAEHKVIVLEDVTTGTKAGIFAFGALLNVFSIKLKNTEHNIIDGFQNTEDAVKNITAAFQSTKLSPFVCRLREGQYTFANNAYKVEKYYTYREALHGLIYDAVFTVTEMGATDDSSYVILSYDYNKADPGYPFFYRIQVRYKLSINHELMVSTTITNTGEAAIPISDGWHPYFTLGKNAGDLELFINTTSMVEFDNRLLPTGNMMPFDRYSHLQKIGDAQIDNCFILQDNNTAACLLRNPENGLQLTIHPDAGYPYLQIFIPPHRCSIAIENLSSLPDAFNNGVGLIALEPAASTNFATRFAISANQF